MLQIAVNKKEMQDALNLVVFLKLLSLFPKDV